MRRKLTIDEITKRLCDTFWNVDRGNCGKCPYCNGDKCTLEADLRKLFAPTPIPSAKEWVTQMNADFAKHKGLLRGLLESCTVIVDTCKDTMALAKCSVNDTYDMRIGTAIAYARLCGLPIHPEYAAKKDKVLGRDE